MNIGRLWDEFYNRETREFTLSVMRDFWKSALILLAAGGFFMLLRMFQAMGYSRFWLKVWDWMDATFTTIVLGWTFYVFLGKLVFSNASRRGSR